MYILLLTRQNDSLLFTFLLLFEFLLYHLTPPKGIDLNVILRKNENGDSFLFQNIERMSQKWQLEKVSF